MDAYDVIIIGTGAGGAPWLGTSHLRALVLERGDWFLREPHLAPARLHEDRDSGGRVYPALTAMANALRVGDHLLARRA